MGIDRGFDSTKAPQTTKLAHTSLHLATSTQVQMHLKRPECSPVS